MSILEKTKKNINDQKAYFRNYHKEIAERSVTTIKIAAISETVIYIVFQIISLLLYHKIDLRLQYLLPCILIFLFMPFSSVLLKKKKYRAIKYTSLALQLVVTAFILMMDSVLCPFMHIIYVPFLLALSPLLFYLPIEVELVINTAAYAIFVVLIYTVKTPECHDHDFFQTTISYAVSLITSFIVLDSRLRTAASDEQLRIEQEATARLEEANRCLEEARKTTEQAYIIAERANHSKTIFLNNMSHDIRTPMNAIVGFSSLAITHIENPERVKDYLSKILSSSNHLLSLINDVLDMSRIESGKVQIKEEECSLPVIMHDIRNILQGEVKAKNLEFFIDTVDVVDENIICDKVRLSQIILNCTSNAVKYTKPGGTVGVRVIQKENAPEGYADFDFIIRDTGIGMHEEFVEHIFEPFSREETNAVHQTQGTGLGMSIVKNIVDMMGGRITVRSKPEEGTEFTISLRFKVGSGSKKITVIKNLEGMRALVADDDSESCLSVSRMLKSIGMRSEWTTLGKEAIVRAEAAQEDRDPFKVYIIDWLMPDMNGVEVVRRIRQKIGNDIPIIILTAYDWTDIEEEAREAGVTAFCDKPIFLSELYYVLQKASSPQPEKEKVISYNDTFKGKRLLLVDDVELNREIAQAILEEAGLHVETCSNGREAVEYVKNTEAGHIDMILMDIMMPVMDGYEASRQIRALPDTEKANVPIVALTANAFEEDRQAALDAGMNDHISKPVQIEALYAIMRQYLR